MSTFTQKHKYHLLAFIILILITIISGYRLFTTHDTPNTIQNTWNKIQGETKKELTLPMANNIKLVTKIGIQTPSEDRDDDIRYNTTTTFTNPIIFKINNEEYISEFSSSTTVYKLMQNLSASSVKPFMFSGKDYGAGMGYFVTEINEIKNDPQAGRYWIYYVNGESAQVGISNYIINQGDLIEWKYE